MREMKSLLGVSRTSRKQHDTDAAGVGVGITSYLECWGCRMVHGPGCGPAELLPGPLHSCVLRTVE